MKREKERGEQKKDKNGTMKEKNTEHTHTYTYTHTHTQKKNSQFKVQEEQGREARNRKEQISNRRKKNDTNVTAPSAKGLPT